MPDQLIEYLDARRRAVIRRSVAQVRKRPEIARNFSAALLRERYGKIVDTLLKWLEGGGMDRELSHDDPAILDLVDKGIPLSRLTKNVLLFQNNLIEDFAKHSDLATEEFAHRVGLLTEFMRQFMHSFAEAYEQRQQQRFKEIETQRDTFFQQMIFPAFLAEPTGTVTAVNRAMTEFLGVPCKQLLGRAVAELLCHDDACTLDMARMWGKLKAQRRVDRFPVAVRRPTGELQHVEISATFRRNRAGRETGIQGFVQDVTRRVESEQLVEEQRRTLEAIFEQAPLGLSFVDEQQRVTMINTNFTTNLGFEPEERDVARGMKVMDRVQAIAPQSHREPQRFIAFVTDLLEHPERSAMEEFQLTNGKTVLIVSAPVSGAQGGYLGRIVVNQDLTHQRELEQLREDLMQMIVHDLKNPLTAIRMSASLLQSVAEDSEENRIERPAALIASSANNMLRMIMNLLDISRMEENKLKPRYEAVNLRALLAELQPELEAMAQRRRLKLPSRLDKQLVLECDPTMLRRVVENIVGNAVKHTRNDGEVRVQIRRQPRGWLSIAISDNGEGIAPEDQATIFEKFGQAASRQRGRKTDTGLGLTFCKLAVEAHGGKLTLRSAPGEGSTFKIKLPLSSQGVSA